MPPNIPFISLILIFLSQAAAKTSFIDVHVKDGKLVASHKSDKEVNFQRHYSVKGSYNPAEEPLGVVEVKNDASLANTNSPYARTFTNSESLSGLFEDENQSEDIFIYKQIIGQSKKFMFSLESSGPENYERPKDFADGDFQMMRLYLNEFAHDKKLIPIALCEFNGSFQIRKHGNCGKKWELKYTLYAHDTPTTGTQLIYIGSRDSKPWDSRASTRPLTGTPFTRNQFIMYAEIEQNVEVQDSTKLEDYSKLYHYVGWTTRYSSTNLTYHYYSTSSNPPAGFTAAEFGARSVPGFNFYQDVKEHKGLQVFYICEKEEKKSAKANGSGVEIVQKRALFDSPCSKSYVEVGTFTAWNKQADAPEEAIEIFVTRRRIWPFDTLLSFTHLSKTNLLKPAFSFWAIPMEVETEETVLRRSGLVVSGIRSDRMTIEWRKDPFVKMYKVKVTPKPSKMTQFETKENRLRLKGLDADTEYVIEITPTTSGGINLQSMSAVQNTAPAPPKLKFPLIRSTSFEIDIGQIPGVEDYRLKIEPEVVEIPSESSYLTVKAEPETEYTVTLVVVISKAKDIQTTEVKRIIKTSPSPKKLRIDMHVVDDDSVDITLKGLENEALGYRFKVEASDKIPSLRRDQYAVSNTMKLPHVVGNNKETVTMRVAATLGGSSGEHRETDFISISTPFKPCHWVKVEKKLSCSGKEGIQSQMLSWTINKDNMVEVRTADNSRTTIRKSDVETLNIDNNLLDGLEFKKFVSQFPNLQKLNASHNALDELEEDSFSRNPKLWKIVLSNNFIKNFPPNLFRYTQALQILDVSFNPLEYCGLGHTHLQLLETKLRKLDIRGTKFPEDLIGHWNALMLYYDVGSAPNYIHEAVYPRLCPRNN